MITLIVAAVSFCTSLGATGGSLYEGDGRRAGRVACERSTVVVRDREDRVLARIERRKDELEARGPDGRMLFTLR
jgi:hypothetical protein